PAAVPHEQEDEEQWHAEQPHGRDEVRHRQDAVHLDITQTRPVRVFEELGHAWHRTMRPVSEPTSSPEPSVFSRIISGEFPGRFVWRDENVVAFLTIAPMRPGHVLVVPVEQIDKWTDVPPDLWAELSRVAHLIGG